MYYLADVETGEVPAGSPWFSWSREAREWAAVNLPGRLMKVREDHADKEQIIQHARRNNIPYQVKGGAWRNLPPGRRRP